MRSLSVLNRHIICCTACPRLVAYRESIASTKRRQFMEQTYWGRPIPGFGDPQARLYVLGLAPAAHGGNRTGRVFTGDRSGDWLYDALHRFGFASQAASTHRDDGMVLTDCYIGATVRCAPPDNKPLPEEFAHCQGFLLDELRLLTQMRVVVALGKIAFDHYLKACQAGGLTKPSPAPKFGHGAAYILPWGITLLGSYHPSQQNTFTGKLTRPMFHSVFARARGELEKPPAPPRTTFISSPGRPNRPKTS
ncbi:MAG: uracil-DNA glycosylase [Nitrospira sp.]|jgi:uracil-DNA glycosylase family 4|nr:uracil-DNA glycosylase [Nitrospira sp.]